MGRGKRGTPNAYTFNRLRMRCSWVHHWWHLGEGVKVEAAWRGEGRLEILISGIAPHDATALLESLEASSTEPEPEVDERVGWAMGFTGGTFIEPVFHWFFEGRSRCRRWFSKNATGPFVPSINGNLCRGCDL